MVTMLKAAHCAAPCMNGGIIRIDIAPADRAGLLGELVVGRGEACSLPQGRPPIDDRKMSCWRHSTPFGMPVVPPV